MRGKTLVMEQGNQETEKWKRLLDCLQQKNVTQKYHLAEILKKAQREKDKLVLLAEQYQNQLLQQDEAFKLMRNDIATLEKLVAQDQHAKNQAQNICRNKKKLEQEMRAFQANFNRLSSEFTVFVLSVGSLCL
jgi:hypothetical protein